ncbi:MAG: hypothetical protein NT083_00350 [Rhodocyclales bacterium]|nr:hypothetical protein [Rhodocyclales bacterium]
MNDRAFMLHAFKGNASAVEYVLAVAKVADCWDSLVDRDVPVPDTAINDAFWLLAVEIPRNPFFQAFANDLLPVTATGILNWLAANRMERDASLPHRAIEIAHVIRYSIADVALMAALLCGGREWAAEVGPELRLRSQRSDLNEYINSLKGVDHANQ